MNRMAHTNTGELVDAFAHYCQHYDTEGDWDYYPDTKDELVENIKLGIANMDLNPEPDEYVEAVADAILEIGNEAERLNLQAAEAERTERQVCHGPEDAITSDDPMAPYNPDDYLPQDEEDRS